MSITFKDSSSKSNAKSLVYYSKHIEIFLNEKHNWCSPGTIKVHIFIHISKENIACPSFP